MILPTARGSALLCLCLSSVLSWSSTLSGMVVLRFVWGGVLFFLSVHVTNEAGRRMDLNRPRGKGSLQLASSPNFHPHTHSPTHPPVRTSARVRNNSHTLPRAQTQPTRQLYTNYNYKKIKVESYETQHWSLNTWTIIRSHKVKQCKETKYTFLLVLWIRIRRKLPRKGTLHQSWTVLHDRLPLDNQ